MSLIYAYQNRGLTKDFTIDDINGDAITPGMNDKLRISIGRLGEIAKLIFTSDAATANGSSVTRGASNRLRLDAADLALIDPGTYTLVVDYYDNADAQEWKTVSRQVFVLEET